MNQKAKRLFVIESPGKQRTLSKILGNEFKVIASMGHVRDLPADELGIDVEAAFKPKWVAPAVKGKGAVSKRLTQAMQAAEAIYLATDPDREGEAIAAHILALTKIPKDVPVMRVSFTAITKEAVRYAVENPRPLDMALVAAQHARRKLDRLVGYLVSPLACRVLDGRYSAGRVQSPALRLVVERERTIEGFSPETYFTLDVLLGAGEATFRAKLTHIQGQAMPLKDAAFVKKLAEALQGAVYWVDTLQTEDVPRKPPAPFTTSSLQQAASSQLGLSPEKTMQLAQTLYEAGMITYIRSDAVFVASEAQATALEFIGRAYGERYLPAEKPIYKSKANAQEAHEAIRPTDVTLTPDEIKEDVGDGAALYGLIWRRFLASQMAAAVERVQVVSISAGKATGQPFPLTLEARGTTPVFDGFRRVYQAGSDTEEDEIAEVESALPTLEKRQLLTLHKVIPQQKQTQAPARFTEAQIVRELEKRGIGRPSTYAAILSNIKSRNYVTIQNKRLVPTESGRKLLDYLLGGFAPIIADDYTAKLEAALDDIAQGKVSELDTLNAFWEEFQPLLRGATAELNHVRPQSQKTGEICPQCGADLIVREGKRGQFVGCSTFPKCRYTVGLVHQPLMIQPAE